MNRRTLARLVASSLLVGLMYGAFVLLVGVLVFDDWLHDWTWWQMILLWVSYWLTNRVVTPHTTAWIERESK